MNTSMSTQHTPGPCERAYLRGMTIVVTEAETAALIRQSSPERPYIATFGPHGVQLWAHERVKWAYVAVDEMRAKATGSAS